MSKKVQQSGLKKTKLHIQLKYIKALILISGFFSIIISCNSNTKISEKDKLVHRFFEDNIKNNKGEKIYIAIISSACEDCINTNINFIKKWEQENLKLTYLMDTNMANEISKEITNINEKSLIVNSNIFVKYGITEGRMLVLYANDNKLESIEMIADGIKTYTFKE